MTTENIKIDGRSSRLARETTLWLAIACVPLAAIGFSWNPTPLAHALYRELGMEAMKENAEWVAIYRQRPIRPLQ